MAPPLAVSEAPAPRGVDLGVLRAQRDAGRKLLVTYVTGGLRDDWVAVLDAMVAAGADLVEIGLPFSDPVMDGPTIQEASAASLARGTNPGSILADLRRVDAPVPLVAMTYANLVIRGGHRRFAASLAAAGVRGAIIPDIPLEELDDWARAAAWAGVDTVLLAAPVTPDGRLAELCRRSRGFVYGVNVMGVTGERTALSSSAGVLATRLKAITDLPVIMGFGVSGPDQAAAIAEVADGVVVASALMRAMLSGEDPEQIGERVAALRAALDAG
jgi:tryptophan synthase alpha chain